MAEKLTDAQIKLLKDIADNNGIRDYTIEQYSMSSKGDNYVGQIMCATIKSRRDDETLELVVKKTPSNEDFRKAIPVRDIFLREIYIYDKVHNYFKKFQNEKGVESPFNSIAKYYGKCEEELSECLVLENLIKNGYGLWNRKLPMNAEHISIVMSEYGKFHAVSYAMKEKNPELFSEISECLKQEPTQWEIENMKTFLQSIIPQLQKVVDGNAVLQAALLRMASNLEHFFKVEIQEPKEKMVITHGDCWCNNILFKYGVSRKFEVYLEKMKIESFRQILLILFLKFSQSSSIKNERDLWHINAHAPRQCSALKDMIRRWNKQGKIKMQMVSITIANNHFVDSELELPHFESQD